MLKFIALAAFAVVVVYAGTSAQSNKFVDDLFTSSLRSEAPNYNLVTGITVPNFDFKIKATGLTNRDLKAKFTNGKAKGFTNLKRYGECSPSSWIGGNITLSCRIDLSGVVVEYESEVKGYNLVGTEKKIKVDVRLVDTTALFEATSFPNRGVALRTFYIEKMKTKLDYEDLGLHDERKSKFKEEVEKKTIGELYNVFYNQFSKAIGSALSRSGVVLPGV